MKKENCANRLKQALQLRDMKQAELSRITGISKPSIHQYVTGEHEPKQNPTYLMAKALNVSEAWLMGFDVPIDRIESIKTVVTREEKDIIDLYEKLDAEDRINLKNYLNAVLLASPKYKCEYRTD